MFNVASSDRVMFEGDKMNFEKSISKKNDSKLLN